MNFPPENLRNPEERRVEIVPAAATVAAVAGTDAVGDDAGGDAAAAGAGVFPLSLSLL
jgi:hypothetical protein